MKKSTMILLLLVALVAALGGGIGHAADCGDGGSPANSSGSCESADNQVTCGDGQAAGGLIVSSNNGAEVCSDANSGIPLSGRIGTEGPDCDCVYADGTAGNQSPLTGWVRVDQNGASCEVSGEQSYNSGDGGACNAM